MRIETALSRRSFVIGAAALGAAAFAGCSSPQDAPSSDGGASSAPSKVMVGTLATEDILPLWVAQQEDLAADKVEFEVVAFQSATELIAGISSGAVNVAMTDPMVSAGVFASGTGLELAWVTLGETAKQGRFGIMTGPNTGITSLSELAGVPVGVGSNTILEYVMDKLMECAGIPEDQVKVEELQKLPVRFQSMMSGDVKAAALPGALLALGEASGCVCLADDTEGDNISQSVMAVRSDFVSAESGAMALAALQDVWDGGAALVNRDPEKYRSLLVANANLPESVARTYPISEYPIAKKPTGAMVDPVLAWMMKKGYLTSPLSYDENTGKFSKE